MGTNSSFVDHVAIDVAIKRCVPLAVDPALLREGTRKPWGALLPTRTISCGGGPGEAGRAIALLWITFLSVTLKEGIDPRKLLRDGLLDLIE
jgi:hypothetical protein